MPHKDSSISKKNSTRQHTWAESIARHGLLLAVVCLLAMMMAGPAVQGLLWGAEKPTKPGKRNQSPAPTDAAKPKPRPEKEPGREIGNRETGNRETGTREHPLTKPLQLAKESRQALKDVKDYTATFVKKELVGRQMISQSMDMKILSDPFCVYLHYRGNEHGREVLYHSQKNADQILVHEGAGLKSLVGTLSLPLTAPEVTRENRHPVNKVGISNMLEVIISQWEEELQYGEIEVKYFPKAKVGDVDCEAYQTSHPEPRKEFRFHMTRLYLDKSTRYPIRVEQYNWPRRAGEEPPLVEEYTYNHLKVNVGLTGKTFDRRNPEYKF